MGLYGSPTPKASYLLGSTSVPQHQCASLVTISSVEDHRLGRSVDCLPNITHTQHHRLLRPWVAELADVMSKEKKQELKSGANSGMVKKTVDSSGAIRVPGAYTGYDVLSAIPPG